MQPVEPLGLWAVLMGAVVLGLGLLFGRTFFAVLAGLLVYDIIKLLFRVPVRIVRWLRRRWVRWRQRENIPEC